MIDDPDYGDDTTPPPFEELFVIPNQRDAEERRKERRKLLKNGASIIGGLAGGGMLAGLVEWGNRRAYERGRSIVRDEMPLNEKVVKEDGVEMIGNNDPKDFSDGGHLRVFTDTEAAKDIEHIEVHYNKFIVHYKSGRPDKLFNVKVEPLPGSNFGRSSPEVVIIAPARSDHLVDNLPRFDVRLHQELNDHCDVNLKVVSDVQTYLDLSHAKADQAKTYIATSSLMRSGRGDVVLTGMGQDLTNEVKRVAAYNAGLERDRQSHISYKNMTIDATDMSFDIDGKIVSDVLTDNRLNNKFYSPKAGGANR